MPIPIVHRAILTERESHRTQTIRALSTTGAKGQTNESVKMSILPQAIIEDCLQKLSEKELQSRVVEPLLRANGFDQVRDVSGPYEKGKDLVATKHELGISHFYAIQLKKLRVTGKVGDPRSSLAALMNQLKQAITEPVFDPFTQSSRIPDRLIFITPFAIDRLVLDSAMFQHGELSRNQASIIDGPTLAQDAALKIPHVLASLRDDIGYRLQLSRDYNNIPEARAFGVDVNLSIDGIFVEMEYACLGSLTRLLDRFLENSKGYVGHDKFEALQWRSNPLGKKELHALRKIWAPWVSPVSGIQEIALGEFSLSVFIAGLTKYANYLSDLLRGLASTEITPGKSREICVELAAMQQAMAEANSFAFLKKRYVEISNSDRDLLQKVKKRIEDRKGFATYRHVVNMKGHTVISGPAGAGKTTLMRKLVIHVAGEIPDLTPVFIRVIDIPEVSIKGILRCISDELHARSSPMTKGQLSDLLRSGLLMLVFDGLDEAGARLLQVNRMLRNFVATYSECPVFISCRDTVDMSDWTSAIHLTLTDFSGSQLNQFVSNWFAARPSLVNAVEAWFSNSPEMKKNARRPIIAALICSLFDADADLPASETELYASRAELLVGKWERAKGIPPMRRDARERYLLFLMELAYDVHSSGEREFPHKTVDKHAKHYYLATWSRSIEGFIQDCVSRGLLSVEGNGAYSFGHLTYQEFFVSKFLAHHNDVDDIASKLGLSWWRKTLEFYASLQMDITPLARAVKRQGKVDSLRDQLTQLFILAPLTDRSAFQ